MEQPTGAPIEVREISKGFRVDGHVVEALRDVSLVAEEGQFVSLIGPSGCGKSTLLNIISGLMRPDAGEVLLYGRAEDSRLGRVGYMPQKDLLLPWRSLLDNLLLGPEIRGRNLEQARHEAIDLMEQFGLAGFEDSLPATLSGGMRQRAALLRTLMCHQDVLLLDEPLGALDALTRREMRQWLLDVWQTFRKTMIFVTHDVDEAIYLADHVFVMSSRPGTIVSDLEIELPRPRSEELTCGNAFLRYRTSLLDSLGV
ncbi:MAG: ABC transporter ATP-binding protein [Anaerolineae bacterium]|nr:ABC transporter ATP-binding protein [Anaerolineae bacterium]